MEMITRVQEDESELMMMFQMTAPPKMVGNDYFILMTNLYQYNHSL